MSEDGWVTDPAALDIICALKAFRPGDEIKVQGGSAREFVDIPPSHTDSVFTVTEDSAYQVGMLYYQDDPTTEIVVVCENSKWLLCRRNIKGWRRLTKTG